MYYGPYSAGFGYALRAIAQEFFMRYQPHSRVLSCAKGRSVGFCYLLWAIAQDLVMYYGP
jgi:hypothetical protein